jgi:hypothetical protein
MSAWHRLESHPRGIKSQLADCIGLAFRVGIVGDVPEE